MVSSQARALPPAKPPIPRKARRQASCTTSCGVGAIAGEPARQRIGVGEMRQHHALEARVILLAAHIPTRPVAPLSSVNIPVEIGRAAVLFPRLGRKLAADEEYRGPYGHPVGATIAECAGCRRRKLLRRLHVAGVDEAAGLAPPQRGVEAVVRAAARRACPARRCGRGRARPAGPCARWSRAGARWRSRSCPPSACRGSPGSRPRPRCRAREVASSSTRIGASLRITRAIAMRWRWPPDSFTPRSPTCAS